ncbi:MAG: aminoacyl-tRNA hydrolase [Desulfobacteraceae bacterium]|jgi:PTH1 family peptidyl-tRNA hydrolase
MPTKPNYIIAGLGNPGEDYFNTRHNIGFRVVDSLAHQNSLSLSLQSNDASFGIGTIAKKSVLLVKPMSFMNRSGLPIHNLADKYKIIGRKIIIIHDDLDLTFGRLKIKKKGGSGGHRGIGSILDAFEEDNFVRIRIGIGRPVHGESIVDYVLDEFTSDETPMLNEIIIRACDATKTILCQGIREAMNSFNDRRLNTSS